VRFSLIDSVTELDPGSSITIVKNLTRSEEYLADHFPGFPVMPGVMMLETLVQTGAWLMRLDSDFAYSTILLDEAKALRFKSFVAPGDQLIVNVQKHKADNETWTLKAQGKVRETEVVSARLVLKQFNLADRDQKFAENDRRLIEHMKLTWSELERVSTYKNNT
tara:strand:- start:145 stop:636 length:492 start_codon:yes stop_codon:yes gene_type:complete